MQYTAAQPWQDLFTLQALGVPPLTLVPLTSHQGPFTGMSLLHSEPYTGEKVSTYSTFGEFSVPPGTPQGIPPGSTGVQSGSVSLDLATSLY